MKQNHLSIRVALIIFCVLNLMFIGELALELLVSHPGESFVQLLGDAALARASGNSISRAYNVLVSLILTSIVLAIPLTANLYTPQLIEIFIRDRRNVAVVTFFAISAAHATFVPQMTLHTSSGPLYPRIALWVSFELQLLGWSILLPYVYYVFRFLHPSRIIQLISDEIIDAFHAVEGGVRDVPRYQTLLSQRVMHLGSTVLRALGRTDRDMTLVGIRAIERAIAHYLEHKPKFPEAWFRVPREQFVGLSAEAHEDMDQNRTWFERLAQAQLQLVYQNALIRMPDAISALSVVAREIALDADRLDDPAALQLTIRFLNSYIRAAIKQKDIRATFDILHQYKELARELLVCRPKVAARLVEHLVYYARFARMSGMQFVYELSAFEVEQILERAYSLDIEERAEILDHFLTFDGAQPRQLKTLLVAGALFHERGLLAERDRVTARLRHGPDLKSLRAAWSVLEQTHDPMFWEVTDRQVNIDYLPPAKRESVGRYVEWLASGPLSGRMPAPSGRYRVQPAEIYSSEALESEDP